MNPSPLRQVSGWAPVAMSLAALGLVLGHVAVYGIVKETDEGTAAHVYQLLMLLQVPLIGYFALKWLPKAPGKTLVMLGLQGLAGAAALGALLYMEAAAKAL